MIGFPERNEAASYYFTYIDRIQSNDVVAALERQSVDSIAFMHGISEENSLRRYAPDKWSVRQVLNHVSDAERVFAFRAFWFARGFDSPLPSFDQNIAVEAAGADKLPWSSHIQEFRAVRSSTLDLFRSFPASAWTRSGMASGNSVTVRALAYIIAGHLAHHVAIIQERYL